jgi:hypothetical protein
LDKASFPAEARAKVKTLDRARNWRRVKSLRLLFTPLVYSISTLASSWNGTGTMTEASDGLGALGSQQHHSKKCDGVLMKW